MASLFASGEPTDTFQAKDLDHDVTLIRVLCYSSSSVLIQISIHASRSKSKLMGINSEPGRQLAPSGRVGREVSVTAEP